MMRYHTMDDLRNAFGVKKAKRITIPRHQREKLLEKFPYCQICNKQRAEQIHHVCPVTFGGDNREENLRTICKSCHNKESGMLRIDDVINFHKKVIK